MEFIILICNAPVTPAYTEAASVKIMVYYKCILIKPGPFNYFLTKIFLAKENRAATMQDVIKEKIRFEYM